MAASTVVMNHGKINSGSSIAKVREFCSARRIPCKESATSGFLNQETGKTVGVKSMWAVLDKGRFRDVEAFWGFSSDGKLLDVWVRTTYEGP